MSSSMADFLREMAQRLEDLSSPKGLLRALSIRRRAASEQVKLWSERMAEVDKQAADMIGADTELDQLWRDLTK